MLSNSCAEQDWFTLAFQYGVVAIAWLFARYASFYHIVRLAHVSHAVSQDVQEIGGQLDVQRLASVIAEGMDSQLCMIFSRRQPGQQYSLMVASGTEGVLPAPPPILLSAENLPKKDGMEPSRLDRREAQKAMGFEFVNLVEKQYLRRPARFESCMAANMAAQPDWPAGAMAPRPGQ